MDVRSADAQLETHSWALGAGVFGKFLEPWRLDAEPFFRRWDALAACEERLVMPQAHSSFAHVRRRALLFSRLLVHGRLVSTVEWRVYIFNSV